MLYKTNDRPSDKVTDYKVLGYRLLPNPVSPIAYHRSSTTKLLTHLLLHELSQWRQYLLGIVFGGFVLLYLFS